MDKKVRKSTGKREKAEAERQAPLLSAFEGVGVRWGARKGGTVTGLTVHGEVISLEKNDIVVRNRRFPVYQVLEALDQGVIRGGTGVRVDDIIEGMDRYLEYQGRQGEYWKSTNPGAGNVIRDIHRKYIEQMDKPYALYYITSRDTLEDVLRGGLAKTKLGKFEVLDRTLAEVTRRKEKPVILEIDSRKLKPYLLKEEREGFYSYGEAIPSKAITELPSFDEYIVEKQKEESI